MFNFSPEFKQALRQHRCCDSQRSPGEKQPKVIALPTGKARELRLRMMRWRQQAGSLTDNMSPPPAA